jgi:dihydroneopterin aldolase
MQYKLEVQNYEVAVQLGTTVEEQSAFQPVHFSLDILFLGPIAAVQSDNIEDAVDYSELTKIIKFIATSKKYHLVEHLGHQVMAGLIQYLKSKNIKSALKLSLRKIKVPIENLRNGVVFSCETQL